MEIYAEYLFVENFIAGVIILLLLGRITGNRVSGGKLLEGGIFCGLYSFIIFCDSIGGIVAVLCKLLFSLFITVNSFPEHFLPGKAKGITQTPVRRLKSIFKLAALFYIISFALGGMVIACLYISGSRGITRSMTFYTGEITYLSVFAGMAAGYVLLRVASGWMRQKRLEESIYNRVTVSLGEKVWEMKAMMDTGNVLREPVSGRPVCVLWGEYAREIMACAEPERFCIVPYRTLGRNGTLRGIRTDKLTIEGRTIEKVILAVYSEEMCRNRRERYDLILNRAMLEGGIEIDA